MNDKRVTLSSSRSLDREEGAVGIGRGRDRAMTGGKSLEKKYRARARENFVIASFTVFRDVERIERSRTSLRESSLARLVIAIEYRDFQFYEHVTAVVLVHGSAETR